jgi:hypothetical protein
VIIFRRAGAKRAECVTAAVELARSIRRQKDRLHRKPALWVDQAAAAGTRGLSHTSLQRVDAGLTRRPRHAGVVASTPACDLAAAV